MKYVKISLLWLALGAVWTTIAVVAAFYGWWLEPIAPEEDSSAFFEAVVQMIEEQNRGDAALILIEDGEVVQEYYGGNEGRIDRDTLFPTASFSKWITAWGVMTLVEDGRVDLDVPVSTYLTRWRLPEGQFDNDGVTTRRLLSHTAGLTDRLGFGDYRAEEVLPSLEESLERPRASRDREAEVSVGKEPGTEWVYSGGGYLILQLLIEEVTGQSFEAFMRARILEPIGMFRSTYQYIGGLENVARSFDNDGALAPHYQYAAAAATGFASSGADLSRFVRAQIPDAVLPSPLLPDTILALREPHGFILGTGVWGLGTILYSSTPNDETVFGHDGANDPAINTSVRINPDTRDGFVSLVTGHPSLASTLGYHWVLWQTGYPDFLSTDIALESAFWPSLIGIGVITAIVLVWLRRAADSPSP